MAQMVSYTGLLQLGPSVLFPLLSAIAACMPQRPRRSRKPRARRFVARYVPDDGDAPLLLDDVLLPAPRDPFDMVSHKGDPEPVDLRLSTLCLGESSMMVATSTQSTDDLLLPT
jgi:hypothetical protein